MLAYRLALTPSAAGETAAKSSRTLRAVAGVAPRSTGLRAARTLKAERVSRRSLPASMSSTCVRTSASMMTPSGRKRVRLSGASQVMSGYALVVR